MRSNPKKRVPRHSGAKAQKYRLVFFSHLHGCVGRATYLGRSSKLLLFSCVFSGLGFALFAYVFLWSAATGSMIGVLAFIFSTSGVYLFLHHRRITFNYIYMYSSRAVRLKVELLYPPNGPRSILSLDGIRHVRIYGTWKIPQQQYYFFFVERDETTAATAAAAGGVTSIGTGLTRVQSQPFAPGSRGGSAGGSGYLVHRVSTGSYFSRSLQVIYTSFVL